MQLDYNGEVYEVQYNYIKGSRHEQEIIDIVSIDGEYTFNDEEVIDAAVREISRIEGGCYL